MCYVFSTILKLETRQGDATTSFINTTLYFLFLQNSYVHNPEVDTSHAQNVSIYALINSNHVPDGELVDQVSLIEAVMQALSGDAIKRQSGLRHMRRMICCWFTCCIRCQFKMHDIRGSGYIPVGRQPWERCQHVLVSNGRSMVRR